MTNSHWKEYKRGKFGKEHKVVLRDINIQASNKKVLLGMILEVGKILWSVWTSNIVDGLILVEPDILMANVFVQHALVHK